MWLWASFLHTPFCSLGFQHPGLCLRLRDNSSISITFDCPAGSHHLSMSHSCLELANFCIPGQMQAPDSPASMSQVLGFQTCAVIPCVCCAGARTQGFMHTRLPSFVLALAFAAPISLQTCLSLKVGTGLLELTDLCTSHLSVIGLIHRTSELSVDLLTPGDSHPA